MKAIIVDDEENNIANLDNLIRSNCKNVIVDFKCTNSFEAKKYITTNYPDLVFLDINMPMVNGIELLELLNQSGYNKSLFIIVTAHEEFALNAIKLGAFSYLLKPIDRQELIKTIDNASKIITPPLPLTNEIQIQKDSKGTSDHIIINSENSSIVLKYLDIIKIESDNNYTLFFVTDNKKYLSSKTLKYYEDILPNNNFLRIHKCFIVNKLHVKGFGKKEGKYNVHLTNNLTALVAVDKKTWLKKEIQS